MPKPDCLYLLGFLAKTSPMYMHMVVEFNQLMVDLNRQMVHINQMAYADTTEKAKTVFACLALVVTKNSSLSTHKRQNMSIWQRFRSHHV